MTLSLLRNINFSFQQWYFVTKIVLTKVLIFCVELRELSHLTHDLSQAEKKMNVVASSANAQNDIYFIQNGQSCHFE